MDLTTTTIINRIFETKEKLIRDTLLELGFDKEYIIKHRKEFAVVIQDGYPRQREHYLHNGKFLFCCFTEYGKEDINIGIEYDDNGLFDRLAGKQFTQIWS